MAYNSPQQAVRFDFYLGSFKFLIQFLSSHLCLVLSETFAISSRDFKGREPYLSESLLQKLQPLPLMWSVWSTSSSWLQNKMKTVIVAEGCRCWRSLSLRCSQTTNEPAWHFLQRPWLGARKQARHSCVSIKWIMNSELCAEGMWLCCASFLAGVHYVIL